MELFTQLFGHLLAFVYHCFDRIVIHGYLTRLSRPEHVVYFFHEVIGAPVITKEILSERTNRYQNWVEAFARNRRIPIEWAEKGIRKEDFVRRWQRRAVRNSAYGVYFIFKSMEVGPTFRITVPKYPTKDPITASSQTSGVASPTTIFTSTTNCSARSRCVWLRSSLTEHQLRHAKIGFRKAHQKWKEIDHKTQRLYEQGLALFANHELKDGTRAGSKQISQFTKGFVDAKIGR